MTGVYLICFVVFPVSVLMRMKMRQKKRVLLEKEDVDVIKGIAACLVILAHLIMTLKTERTIGPCLNIFQVTGVIGVFLFFFVSGYGLYKGYGEKKAGLSFWKKRLFNMYLPCVLIQFIFCLIRMFLQKQFSIRQMLFESLFYGWFIDVIMIQYMVFFISWILAKGRQNVLIMLTYLLSGIVCLFFYIQGFDARWYNNLWLFPIGMTAAWQEQKLIHSIERKWGLYITLSFILFAALGGVRTHAYWFGNPAGTDVIKAASGICLSIFICAVFFKIQFGSDVMKYIGKRSLFFYIVHVELIEIIGRIETVNSIQTFYIVLVLSFFIVELFYDIYIKWIKRV